MFIVVTRIFQILHIIFNFIVMFDAIIYAMDDLIIKKLSKDLNFTFLPFSNVVKTFKVKF